MRNMARLLHGATSGFDSSLCNGLGGEECSGVWIMGQGRDGGRELGVGVVVIVGR